MSQPYLGEIRLFPYPRGAPANWHLCDGSLISISEYDALYVVLGTTFGGDGQQTFGLPDLRGRIPIHQGTGRGLSTYAMGQMAGTETVTLTSPQMAQHQHIQTASTAIGTAHLPTGNLTAVISGETFYGQGGDGSTAYPLPANTIGAAGGNQAHENIAPTLTLNYCIAMAGVFPTQN
jgi:microcystin-dependent protein